jgi:hypothetical protein
MDRNYLKGVLGDTINPILAAAAFNFLKYARLEFTKFNFNVNIDILLNI